MKRLKVLTVALAILVVPALVQARVSGPCADCHTMHNSQGGADVVAGGPFKALTKGGCVQCHTGTNTGNSTTIYNSIPYVLDTTAPTYNFDGSKNTLAGGNFYWVQNGNDAAGHNVAGVANADASLSTPPGFVTTYGRSSWPSGQQVTCAGTYGCHGDPSKADDFAAISGAHHADDSVIDGSTVGKSFRFLLGIKGTEDSDWEYTVSSSDHNGYYAVDYQTTGTVDTASINYLCAECHGNFHSQSSVGSGSSPWLRHPTDFDMNSVSTKEYGNYPNPTLFTSVSTTGEYFPDVPVGNTAGAVKSTVLQAAGDAIVLCISCHRAHGSPYADLLRWDYSTCTASTQNAQCGCFACHTSK